MSEALRSRFEPWPWAVAGLLCAMISTCLLFWWIAVSHPDPVIADDVFGLPATPSEAGEDS